MTALTGAAPQPKVFLLAVDHLDWGLMSRLADQGRMPHAARWLEEGLSGRIAMPAPPFAAAQWSTVATGVLADEHGVLHDQAVMPDGFRVQKVRAGHLRSAPLWQRAAALGLPSRVLAWPATTGVPALAQHATAAGASSAVWSALQMVSDGFEQPDLASPLCWPLDPQAAFPAGLRELVDEARVHPDDLEVRTVQPLLARPRPAGQPDRLLRPARHLAARWMSVHNLGVHWAQQPGGGLLCVRLQGLADWVQELHRHAGPGLGADALAEHLAPWYAWLDQMIGRYRAVLGPGTHGLLLSNGGTPGLPPEPGAQPTSLFEPMDAGGLAWVGPGVPADGLLENISALDIAPTVMGLLGGTPDPRWTGRDLRQWTAGGLPAPTGRAVAWGRLRIGVQPDAVTCGLDELLTPPRTDTAALRWLAQQGQTVLNTEPLTQGLPSRVKAETCVGWARLRRLRGDADAAAQALEAALALHPQQLQARWMLGELLLQAGRFDDCRQLVAGLPEALRQGPWADVVPALVAFSSRDWGRAEQHLLRLVQAGSAPINAPAWLGRVRLAQGDGAGAEHWLRQALGWPGEPEQVQEALGLSLAAQGHHAQAAQHFSLALTHAPADAHLHQLRAQALAQAGNATDAQAGYWRALALDPSSQGVVRQLVELAGRAGRD